MKVYTLTLNPAYDVHAFCAQFRAGHENLADTSVKEAGGKGVNISRALTASGVPNTAVIVIGSENGAEFRRALAADRMQCIYCEREGRIRENLTIHSPGNPETRLSFSGFPVDERVLSEIEGRLDVDADTVVAFTGRVPSGIPLCAVKNFLLRLRQKGARIVLDSKSFALADLLDVAPWLVKPNQEEISELFGCEVNGFGQTVELARQLAQGGIAHVMISLGEQGAALLHQGQLWVAAPPAVEAISTIGAGDSSIAGFIAAAAAGEKPKMCLRNAVAYGTAACLTPGTQPPRGEDIRRILPQIRLTGGNDHAV